jgi:hypothetical protein
MLLIFTDTTPSYSDAKTANEQDITDRIINAEIRVIPPKLVKYSCETNAFRTGP